MNIMSITAAGSLNFSVHEDKKFRGTVDFIWSALNKFDPNGKGGGIIESGNILYYKLAHLFYMCTHWFIL